MAARRLIIVMLVLLGISTAVAIITPVPEEDAAEERVTGTTGETGSTGTTGETAPEEAEPAESNLVEATVKSGEEPKTVKASPGDRLVLQVDPGRASDVEVTGLGLTGTTTPYAPAYFDVRLPSKPGTYEVVDVDSEKELAVIETTTD